MNRFLLSKIQTKSILNNFNCFYANICYKNRSKYRDNVFLNKMNIFKFKFFFHLLKLKSKKF